MRKALKLALLLVALTVPAFATHTCGVGVSGGANQPNACYIGATGSDSNSGIDQAHAWLHAPGMPSATGNASSQVPQAGDQYIFRGGDAWHRSASTSDSSDVPIGGQWTFSASGASATCNYLTGAISTCISLGGLDPTWYNSSVCGASFCSPQFELDNPVWASSTHQDGSHPGFITSCTFEDHGLNGAVLSGSYLIFENWNIWGKCWTVHSGSDFGTTSEWRLTGTHVWFVGLYGHGWTEAHVTSPSDFDQTSFLGDYSGTSTSNGNGIDLSVFDGSDTGPFTGSTPGCTATGFCTGGPINYNGIQFFRHSVCRNMANCLNPDAPETVNDSIFDSDFESWDGSDHGGIVEATGSVSGTAQNFYNNLVRNSDIGITFNPNLNNAGLNVFNNVYFNIGNGANCVALANASGGGTNPVLFINNTMDNTNLFDATVCGMRLSQGGAPAIWQGTATFQNNQFISYANLAAFTGSAAAGQTLTDNGDEIFQSEATANGLGYVRANNYAPTSGTNPTVGAGGNLTGTCSGIADTLAAAACKNSIAGITYNTTTHAITVNAATARPSSGAWDIGAYEFGTPQTLAVTVTGTGAGLSTVASSPSGIVGCLISGGTCSAGFTLGTSVTLTATPAVGSYFYGWSGAGCSGISTCTVVMSANEAVTALFVPAPLATGPYPGYAAYTGLAIVQPPSTPNFGNLVNNGATVQDSSYPSGTAAIVARCTDSTTTASTNPNQTKTAGLGGSGDAMQLVSANSTMALVQDSGGQGFLIPINAATPSCGAAITADKNLTNPGSSSTAYNFAAGSFDWINPAVWYTVGGNNDTSNTQCVSYTFNASNQFTVGPLWCDFQYALPLGSNVVAWQASHSYATGAYVTYTLTSGQAPDWSATTTYGSGHLGDLIKPSIGNPAGCAFKLIALGTTGSSEPAWGSTCSGANITDGSAQWSGILGPPTFVYQLISTGGTSGASTPAFVPVSTGHPDIASLVTDSSLTWMNVGPDITDLQGMWSSFAGVSRDGMRVGAAFSSNAYGYNGSYTGENADQGTGVWATAYSRTTNEYYLLNTATGIQSAATCAGGTGYNCFGGTWALNPVGTALEISTGGCGFFIHNFKGSATMDYPALTVQGSYLAGSSGCGSPESIWTPFASFNSTTSVQNVIAGWNHWTLGYSHGMNLGQAGALFGFTTGAYEGIYDLTNPDTLGDVLIGLQPTCDPSWFPGDSLPPCQSSLAYDSHMSWAYDPSNSDNTPVTGTIYNVATLSPVPVAPWQGEEVSISTSPVWANGASPNPSAAVYRHTHNWASGACPVFSCQFQISEASGDGTILLFGSDMWNPATQTCGLGNTAGGTTSLCGPPWLASTAYSNGNMVNPFSSTGGSGTNFGVYEVTTPGTSASSAPAWFVCNSGTAGNTITDGNGVVYTCQGTGNAKGEVFIAKLSLGAPVILPTPPTGLVVTKQVFTQQVIF